MVPRNRKNALRYQVVRNVLIVIRLSLTWGSSAGQKVASKKSDTPILYPWHCSANRLVEEETWRQALEDTEVNIKLEDVRRLIMEYMVRY